MLAKRMHQAGTATFPDDNTLKTARCNLSLSMSAHHLLINECRGGDRKFHFSQPAEVISEPGYTYANRVLGWC